jgi:hypothetical protein
MIDWSLKIVGAVLGALLGYHATEHPLWTMLGGIAGYYLMKLILKYNDYCMNIQDHTNVGMEEK